MGLRRHTSRTSNPHRLVVAVAGLATAAAVVSCSSSGGSSGRVAIGDVAAAREHLADGAPCPFGAQVPAALKNAGVDAEVRPDAPASTGDYRPPQPGGVAPSMGATEAGEPSTYSYPPLKEANAIDCMFLVGDHPLTIQLVATGDAKAARNLLLPQIMASAEIGSSDEAFLAWVRDMPSPDKVVMPPNGHNVAFVRIPVKGAGDVGLLVRTELDPAHRPPDLTGATLQKITEALEKHISFPPR